MIQQSRAIVLRTYKYSESSLIVHTYTEQWGRQAFIAKGVHGKKAVLKVNFFQPLFLLDVEVYKKENRELNILKEARIYSHYANISSSNIKTSLVLFLSEILHKVLKEEISNPHLFAYLSSSFEFLDLETNHLQDFHILFLLQLSKFLGFYPSNNFSENDSCFDLLNGQFVDYIPAHGQYCEKDLSRLLSNALNVGISDSSSLHMNRAERQLLLQCIVIYYQLHLQGMGELKSFEIMRELFE